MCDKKLLAGRVLLASFFVYASLYKLFDVGPFAAHWAGAGIPLANFLVIPVGLIHLACAIAVAIGFKWRLAAYVLAASLVIAIPVDCDFWNASGDGRMTRLNGLFLYLSVAGGFLLLAASGAGRYAVERR
jgi:putative oxidoreductase